MYIKNTESDDGQFIKIISKMFSDMAMRFRVDELYLTRVDNWFDHKWLGFSGKLLFELETGMDISISQTQPIWKGGKDVTLPPFSPNRIEGQWHYKISREQDSLILTTKQLHSLCQKNSSENLQSRVLDTCPCGLLLWFSSNTKKNRRGSILVYHTHDESVFTWYVAFEKHEKWKVLKTKNINTDSVRKVFNNYAA